MQRIILHLPTHQYMVDSATYALLRLRVVQMGSGCSGNDIESCVSPYYLPETTVSPKADIDACFICHSLSAQFDLDPPAIGTLLAKITSPLPLIILPTQQYPKKMTNP